MHNYSCIVRWHHGDPVVGVLLLVIMIVTVMEVFISVVFSIHVGLGVKISVHLSVGISVSQFRIVMEWDSAERLEIIWINRRGLWHRFELQSLGFSGR